MGGEKMKKVWWILGLIGLIAIISLPMPALEKTNHLDSAVQIHTINQTIPVTSVLENKTASEIKAESVINAKKEKEVITAEDIELTITKLYYERPFLYLNAQTKVSGETIMLEISEIGEFRDIIVAKVGIITDNQGFIFLVQPATMRDGKFYQLNFYYKGTKIASTGLILVQNGKANFGVVKLSSKNPSRWKIRIVHQKYYDMRLKLIGETNIPPKEKVRCIIEKVVNEYPRYKETRKVMKTLQIETDRYGQINETKIVPLGPGNYRISLSYRDRTLIMGVDVVKKVIGNETVFEGKQWVKNIYVPQSAI